MKHEVDPNLLKYIFNSYLHISRASRKNKKLSKAERNS